MSTQTALALTEIGKPLTQITLPIPDESELKENEVLIKITAVGCEFNVLPPGHYLLILTISQ
jgi:NADPH:quinone reductase-like Zn-dependent oxidoreductase